MGRLTHAGELGGKAEEKQTQTWTEEEIPQGLSGIEKEVVPVLQSPPNLHQVSGIKESISALAFHVWLNHPGQCVRCWTKLILKKKK